MVDQKALSGGTQRPLGWIVFREPLAPVLSSLDFENFPEQSSNEYLTRELQVEVDLSLV